MMMGPARRTFAALSLLLYGSTAGAAAIPAYTVTDLGVGTAQLSKPTGGDATLTSPDGKTVYAFPRTDNQVADARSLFAQFPPFTNAPFHEPDAYDDPRYAYSRFDNSAWLTAWQNRNGVFAGTDIYGVSGHLARAGSAVYYSQRQSDGTFGQLGYGWGTASNLESGGIVARVLDLNNRNQLLGESTPPGAVSFSDRLQRSLVLDDVNTGQLTSLDQLFPGWYIDYGVALDDQGRILLYADKRSTRDYQQHALLLTPAGLSSDPIPTPEPSALATLAVAAFGVAIRRHRQRAASHRKP